MNDIISKLAAGGSSSYSPTIVEADKYEAVRRGRNTFLFTVAVFAGCVTASYGIPNAIVRRYSRRLFREHCCGRVLDLVPKVGDVASVALYEGSSTIRVEFLVNERVVDDGAYRIDESLSEEEQHARRKSMTLDHMCLHDPLWVTSPVTFAVATRSEVLQRQATDMYDTIVVRHELCNMDNETVERVMSDGVLLLKPGGKLLLVEVGAGSLQWVNKFVAYIHSTLKTTLFLCRRYDEMGFAKNPSLELVTFERQLFGFHHTMAWQKKK